MIPISNDRLPIYRTKIPLVDIPWDKIEADLATPNDPVIQIDNGCSTLNLHLRRDLEDWVAPYRAVQQSVVEQFFPYVKEHPYETWLLGNWINKVYPGGILNYHDHRPCDLATVWYLDVPENSGNFILLYDNVEYTITVSSGDYIAFPATLAHRTESNNSTAPRIVMGGNIVWHETLRNNLYGALPGQKLDNYVAALYENRQLELIETLSTWYKNNIT